MRLLPVSTLRWLVLGAFGALALPARAETVTVFAAASLRGALDEVATHWQAETGHTVVVSYAGSSLLARQILAGAPADLYLSASPEWMEVVAQAGLLVEGARVDLLGNRLVLIGHGGAEAQEQDQVPDIVALLDGERLAMALVDAVPAGRYGQAALRALGQWDAVAPLIAQTDNVRAALALVTTGEAPLGIVYATDAMAEPGVRVVAMFPEDSHPQITYPLALLTEAVDPADRAFFEALQGDAARAIFARHGFSIP